MSNQIIQFQQPTEIMQAFDQLWLHYFNPLAAVESVFNHVEKLPSSRTTRHTAKQYRLCLFDFLEFCGAVIHRDQTDPTRITGDSFDFSQMNMHTPQQIDEYIVWSIEQNRASTTISKYLAPVRHYINALRKQSFLGIEGRERYFIYDCKELFEHALDVEAPAPEEKNQEVGIRLTQNQIKQYAAGLDRTTLSGKRDAALFHVMLISGLRVAEVAQMTPNKLSMGKNTYEIRVRRKRNNMKPAVLDIKGVNLINEWIDAYNAQLPQGDTRRIEGDTPIWQPLRSGDNIIEIDEKRLNKKTGLYEKWFDPKKGMSQDSIRRIIARNTPEEIIKALGGERLKPHDARRSLANLLDEANVRLTIIQEILGHSSPTTTKRYIGSKIDLQPGLLTNYISDIWAAAS